MEQLSNALPLQGIKVIEMGQLIAGPFASKLLGEFGAEVIKIEPVSVSTSGVLLARMPAAPSASTSRLL